MDTNNLLYKDEEALRSNIVNDGILGRLSKWVSRHRVRALLALVASGLYFAAECKSKSS
jgi:hypothetical protein